MGKEKSQHNILNPGLEKSILIDILYFFVIKNTKDFTFLAGNRIYPFLYFFSLKSIFFTFHIAIKSNLQF